MTDYRDYQLGSDGADFVEARLSSGNTLAQTVTKLFRADGDLCVTRLPCTKASEAVKKLAEGGIGDPEGSERWLVGVVQEHLVSGPDRLVVVEDALARRGDPALDRLQSPVRYRGNEVYRVIDMANSGEFAIRTILAEADAPHQLVCVFTRSPGSHVSGCSEIVESELETWAELAEAVSVRSYDGEGYVVCSGLTRR